MHNNFHVFLMTLGMNDLLKVFTSSYQHPHNYSLVLIPILFPNSQFPPFISVIVTISSCNPLPLLSQFQSSCSQFPPFVSLIPGPSSLLTTFSQFLLIFFQLHLYHLFAPISHSLFSYLHFLIPGVNLIKFLHVWFTSVAIVLESENNSYTWKLLV